MGRKRLRRAISHARRFVYRTGRTEVCPYCGNEVYIRGRLTEFNYCRKRDCKYRHWWLTEHGVTEFPEPVKVDRKHIKTMRKAVLDNE